MTRSINNGKLLDSALVGSSSWDSSDVVVIFHAACVDGFTSAWLFRWLFRYAVFVSVKHGDARPADDVLVGKRVFIVDFSFKGDVLVEIAGLARSLVVLDHHVSALGDIESLRDFENCGFWYNEGRCGSGIVLDYLFSELVDRSLISKKVADWDLDAVRSFVSYVNDHDLYLFEMPNSRAVRLYFRSVDFDFEVWDSLCAEGFDGWVVKGTPILSYHDRLVEQHVRHARDVVLNGVSVKLVPCTCSSLFSDVGHALALASPSFVGGVFFDTGDGSRVFSLRGVGEGDALSIAKRFGGGGHKYSCAFSVPFVM